MSGLFLSSVYRRPGAVLGDTFPWTLPLFHDLKRVDFGSRVTFLVGENGSGKSTFLEGLAVGYKRLRPAAARSIKTKHCGLPMSSHALSASYDAVARNGPCLYGRRTF